jgi:hypothetical protein
VLDEQEEEKKKEKLGFCLVVENALFVCQKIPNFSTRQENDFYFQISISSSNHLR